MAVALANAVGLVAGYLAAAALIWGIADATMAQPRDLEHFDERPADGRAWRIAHLSDLHVVGERYGFRLESGKGACAGRASWLSAMMVPIGFGNGTTKKPALFPK